MHVSTGKIAREINRLIRFFGSLVRGNEGCLRRGRRRELQLSVSKVFSISSLANHTIFLCEYTRMNALV